ncbi:MAG TPA: A24 family peptidase [Candidatus Acidoferrales bacterium]|nr:A24 family peptidase [Candidatus Acidoferrales bacterium]
MAIVLGAAVYDVRYRRIPNWLTLSGVVLGVLLNAFLYPTGSGSIFGVTGVLFALKGMLLGFAVYLLLYVLRAMGAGDVKLMAAVGAIVGWEDWFGIFILTALIGGMMSIILVVARGRLRRTLFNVGFILSEMKSGRPAYLKNEELDVKSKKSLGLPHGAVIAVGCIFFLAISAHYR